MELTDGQLEVIRRAAREVDYGSVTINISANSNKLDLSVNKRIRHDEVGDFITMGMDVQKARVVCTAEHWGKGGKRSPVKTT